MSGRESNKRFETFRYSTRGGAYGGRAIDPKRCRASVHEPRRGIYQCRKSALYSTDDGGPAEWCKTHSPTTRQAKHEAQDTKYRIENRIRRLHEEARSCAERACAALLRSDVACAMTLAQRRQAALDEIEDLKG